MDAVGQNRLRTTARGMTRGRLGFEVVRVVLSLGGVCESFAPKVRNEAGPACQLRTLLDREGVKLRGRVSSPVLLAHVVPDQLPWNVQLPALIQRRRAQRKWLKLVVAEIRVLLCRAAFEAGWPTVSGVFALHRSASERKEKVTASVLHRGRVPLKACMPCSPCCHNVERPDMPAGPCPASHGTLHRDQGTLPPSSAPLPRILIRLSHQHGLRTTCSLAAEDSKPKTQRTVPVYPSLRSTAFRPNPSSHSRE